MGGELYSVQSAEARMFSCNLNQSEMCNFVDFSVCRSDLKPAIIVFRY